MTSSTDCRHCGGAIYHAATLLPPPLGPVVYEGTPQIWRHVDSDRIKCARAATTYASPLLPDPA